MPEPKFTECIACNSKNITYYNVKKRGAILIVIAVILFPIFMFVFPGGALLSLGCILIIGGKGVFLIYRSIPYYICNDCLHWFDETGKKLGK